MRSAARIAVLSIVAVAACTRPSGTASNNADGAPASDASTPGTTVLADGATVTTLIDGATVMSVPVTDLPGHETLAQDTAPKEGPRLMPAEAYLRTYLQLFGGLAPLAIQNQIHSVNYGLFDTWGDYASALGLPDYRVDLPRGTQTNALMVAAFERLGVALCDMSVIHDLRGAVPVDQRVIFAFELPAPGALDDAAFAQRFDLLHRTFLGYPAALAPTDRTARFRQLYWASLGARTGPDAGYSAFSPTEAGWAAVCYGLVRHPEFHLY